VKPVVAAKAEQETDADMRPWGSTDCARHVKKLKYLHLGPDQWGGAE
jgi:hypothetical protein